MKESIKLWNDLSFYIWSNNWRRADVISNRLDNVKKQRPFIYYISALLSNFIIID